MYVTALEPVLGSVHLSVFKCWKVIKVYFSKKKIYICPVDLLRCLAQLWLGLEVPSDVIKFGFCWYRPLKIVLIVLPFCVWQLFRLLVLSCVLSFLWCVKRAYRLLHGDIPTQPIHNTCFLSNTNGGIFFFPLWDSSNTLEALTVIPKISSCEMVCSLPIPFPLFHGLNCARNTRSSLPSLVVVPNKLQAFSSNRQVWC